MDADVIVAGAGCAGLSLALRIRRLRPDVHIILVDRDHGGHPHKLWSFWSEDPQAMLPLDVPFTSWSTMHAAGPGWSRTKSLRALRYCTVDSEQFEDRAREELRASPGVEFRTGDVKAVTSSYRGARVQLDTHTIRAPYAFQSCLPPSVSAPRYPIWQHFAGVVLRSEAPRFDPSRFTLMDFDVEQLEGPTFMYQLPFSSRETLFEHTVFSSSRMSKEAHLRCVHRELRRRGVRDVAVVREEHGSIPMFEQRATQRRGPRAFNLGVVGGMAKPTTGYAFLRIQQQTEHLAQTWARGNPIPLKNPPWRLRAYDTALLDMIDRDPQAASHALQLLLMDVSADSVLRFLDERPSARDELKIIFGSLPWGPFLKSAARAIRHTPWRVEHPPLQIPGLPLPLTEGGS